MAFTTALGADVFNTEFGFDGLRAFVEETNRNLLRERVRVSVSRCCAKTHECAGFSTCDS